MWELWGVEILAFPLTWHIAYTTACCYRTSRDNGVVCFEMLVKFANHTLVANLNRRLRFGSLPHEHCFE